MNVIKKKHSYNIKDLQLLGSGTQGAVYKIENDKCIKIFKKSEAFRHELKTLQMAQQNRFFPKLYDWGEKYIIREYVDGVELDKYLRQNRLTIDITRKLAEIYDAFVEVGYNRRDTALLHVFLTQSGELRVIDTAKAMEKHSKYPYTMVKDLEVLGFKKDFFSHLRLIRPDLYKEFLNMV